MNVDSFTSKESTLTEIFLKEVKKKKHLCFKILQYNSFNKVYTKGTVFYCSSVCSLCHISVTISHCSKEQEQVRRFNCLFLHYFVDFIFEFRIMSYLIRESSRAIEGSSRAFVRRMVSLPRSILGEFSRVMGQGIDIISTGGRRSNQTIQQNFHFQNPQHPLPVSEEWDFLANFQQQNGYVHPFFYACSLMEVLKIAEKERKFLFIYIHSPDHPFTRSFSRDTLCSELVVQFLYANFICWGALESKGEGAFMASIIKPSCFPFCAVIVPASNHNITLLQQIEGPVSPAEMVEILQTTLEEQGLAFGSLKAKQDEKLRADRRIREEQDAAYFKALHIDKEKEKSNNSSAVEKGKKMEEPSNKAQNKNFEKNPVKNQQIKGKDAIPPQTPYKDQTKATQILIRFPKGEKREQSFSSKDKVKSIYRYIDSLGLNGIENYRLISSFPRRVYGLNEMEMSLKDATLHPRATLFLELH